MTITEFINRQKFSFVDYFDRKSLMRKKPIAIVYQNGDKVVVSDITRIWSDIYVVCCEMLYNDYKNVFKELAGTSLLNHKNCDIALTGHHRNKMVVPKKIAEDAYVETNYCSFDFIDRITALLSKCGLESNAILIAVVDENLSYTNIIKAHIELNTYVTTNEFKKFYSLNLLCSSEKDKGTEVHYFSF